LLPLIGWAATGAIFFVKPGYAGAYEALPVRTYPLETRLAVDPDPAWLEVRYIKTILGEHLLARTTEGWQHLDPQNLRPKRAPDDRELRFLITDAFSINPARYGRIVSVADNVATTDTGVRVTLTWNRLALAQRGKDTDRIDAFYRVHYLQWTGVATLDKILGGLGLALVVALSLLGARLLLR
jgi:hypothetical protein